MRIRNSDKPQLSNGKPNPELPAWCAGLLQCQNGHHDILSTQDSQWQLFGRKGLLTKGNVPQWDFTTLQWLSSWPHVGLQGPTQHSGSSEAELCHPPNLLHPPYTASSPPTFCPGTTSPHLPRPPLASPSPRPPGECQTADQTADVCLQTTGPGPTELALMLGLQYCSQMCLILYLVMSHRRCFRYLGNSLFASPSLCLSHSWHISKQGQIAYSFFKVTFPFLTL